MLSLRGLSRWRPRPPSAPHRPSANFAGRPFLTMAAADNDRAARASYWRSPRPLLAPFQSQEFGQARHASSSSGGQWKGRDARGRVGGGGNVGAASHDYARVGGPIDRSICDLSEMEIRNLINARLQCKRARDFQRADRIQDELRRHGVVVDDRSKEWRADGKKSFERISPPRMGADGHSPQRSSPRDGRNRMPRMRDCQTMDEAILAIHNNLDKASNRDIAAFWAVVPRLLERGQRTREPLVPQLTSIFNKTAEKIGSFGPIDLPTTALGFAKIVVSLGDLEKKKRRVGAYHQCLRGILADKRDLIFQFIASTAVSALPRFDAQGLANLAYAHGLMELAPKLDDGSTLFHHIAENAIPQLGKFNSQNLANTVWAFAKAGVSHPQFFEKMADHIVSLERLDEFAPQALSNTVNAFAKAGLSHPALFAKMGDHIVGLELLDNFLPQDLSITVNAFAKAEASHPRLFEKVADHIVGLGHLHDFKPQELSNTVNAFAKAGVSHPALFEKMADHIVGLDSLNHFQPQNLSNTAWAFATAKVSHPALFEKVADHIISLESTDGFGEQEIANLAWAYQKAGVKNGPLADYLLIAAVEKKDEFSQRTIKNFLYWTEEEGDASGSGGERRDS